MATTWHNSAVCTDCHGVHGILKTDDRLRREPGNLLATCQKCHPSAGPNWTGAWVGHNRIDVQQTPLLYYTEQSTSRSYFCPLAVHHLCSTADHPPHRGSCQEEPAMNVPQEQPAAISASVKLERTFQRFTLGQRWNMLS